MAEPVSFQNKPIVQQAEPGTYWWCACGRTAQQPFCDGSHAGTGLEPLEVQINEAVKAAWCACRRTQTPPFCDGSHKHPGRAQAGPA